jgi:hypothetical protein
MWEHTNMAEIPHMVSRCGGILIEKVAAYHGDYFFFFFFWRKLRLSCMTLLRLRSAGQVAVDRIAAGHLPLSRSGQ